MNLSVDYEVAVGRIDFAVFQNARFEFTPLGILIIINNADERVLQVFNANCWRNVQVGT